MKKKRNKCLIKGKKKKSWKIIDYNQWHKILITQDNNYLQKKKKL